MLLELTSKMEKSISDMDLFLDDDKYIFKEDLEKFLNDNNHKFLNLEFTLNIFKIIRYIKYKKIYDVYAEKMKTLNYLVESHNNMYLVKRHEIFAKECGKVEDRELDYDQIDAIVREDRNQLVLAGAGCGKTTTIVGKVKYLVKVLNVNPEEILLLSFARKSASDMKSRVEKEIGKPMECYTFHKLGLEITKQELNDLSIYSGNMNDFIKEKIKELLSNQNYMDDLVYFLTDNAYAIKDEFRIMSEKEYKEYIEIHPPMTIKGETVKSYGEMEIANYLFSNDINYLYEEKYKYETDTTYYNEYHPDFYLPDYDIYIEYFGIDREGNVPSYFPSRHGKTPKEEYNDGINWKKELHKTNNTVLIDLYYYEKKV